jgi:putative ABC transport system permease protein
MIALPLLFFVLPYRAMNKWLQGFAFRIQINWRMFAVAGFATILIALFTVSSPAIRNALTNPVDSLRSK